MAVQCDGADNRSRTYSAPIDGCSSTAFSAWRVLHPRTYLWRSRASRNQDTTPKKRHLWWREALGLHAHDAVAGEHELLSDFLEAGLVYEQLSPGDICLFELVGRRYQLLEEICAGHLATAENGGTRYAEASDESDENSIFLGHSRGRSIALVSPDLAEFVAATLEERALARRERRRARDERRTVEQVDEPARRRGDPGGKGGGKGEVRANGGDG